MTNWTKGKSERPKTNEEMMGIRKKGDLPFQGTLSVAAAKGRKKTSRLYGKRFKEDRAQKGGQACLLRYGRDFFRSIRAMRAT